MTTPGCHGIRYWYPTPNDGWRAIGVSAGLGATWGVTWLVEGGIRRRVRSKWLASSRSQAELQSRLDAWAIERGLKEVE